MHTALCFCYQWRGRFKSLIGAISPKVKDVLVWTNRVKSLYSSAQECRGFFIPLMTAHVWQTDNTVILQWTSLRSHRFIQVDDERFFCSTQAVSHANRILCVQNTIQIFAPCLVGASLPCSVENLQKLFFKWNVPVLYYITPTLAHSLEPRPSFSCAEILNHALHKTMKTNIQAILLHIATYCISRVCRITLCVQSLRPISKGD